MLCYGISGQFDVHPLHLCDGERMRDAVLVAYKSFIYLSITEVVSEFADGPYVKQSTLNSD